MVKLCSLLGGGLKGAKFVVWGTTEVVGKPPPSGGGGGDAVQQGTQLSLQPSLRQSGAHKKNSKNEGPMGYQR